MLHEPACLDAGGPLRALQIAGRHAEQAYDYPHDWVRHNRDRHAQLRRHGVYRWGVVGAGRPS